MSDTLRPFFLVGCPRSGTTLLQLIIDAHPTIAIPPEGHVFRRFGGEWWRYGDLAQASNRLCLATDLLADARIAEWGLRCTARQLCATAREPSVHGLVDALYTAFARQEGKTSWGDKTPQHAFHLTEIRSVFPEARILHLVRDGRDVAESLKRVYIGPKSIFAIASRWRSYIRTIAEFAEALGPDDYLEVRYEDLVRSPTRVREKILQFLEAEPELPSPHAERSPRRAYYLAAGAHHRSLERPIHAGRIGVYRDALRPREIELFEAVAGAELLELGYALDTDGRGVPNRPEKVRATFLDSAHRYQRKLLTREGRRQARFELRERGQRWARLRRLDRRERSPESPEAP